jgi:hypothetical protein
MSMCRNLSRHNPLLCEKYHPELWAGKWLCCGETVKGVAGCQPISWLPRPTKSDPAPPVPLTDPLLNLGTATECIVNWISLKYYENYFY